MDEVNERMTPPTSRMSILGPVLFETPPEFCRGVPKLNVRTAPVRKEGLEGRTASGEKSRCAMVSARPCDLISCEKNDRYLAYALKDRPYKRHGQPRSADVVHVVEGEGDVLLHARKLRPVGRVELRDVCSDLPALLLELRLPLRRVERNERLLLVLEDLFKERRGCAKSKGGQDVVLRGERANDVGPNRRAGQQGVPATELRVRRTDR